MSNQSPNNHSEQLANALALYLRQGAGNGSANAAGGAGNSSALPVPQMQPPSSGQLHTAPSNYAQLYQSPAATPAVAQGTPSLDTLLAALQRVATSGAAGGATINPMTNVDPSGPLPRAGGFIQVNTSGELKEMNPRFAVNNQPSSDVEGEALGQQILSSARLLSSINPSLAAAAVAYSLTLNSQRQNQVSWNN